MEKRNSVRASKTLRFNALTIATALIIGLPAHAGGRFTTIPGIPGYGPTLPNTGGTNHGDTFSRQTTTPTAISADGAVVVGTHRFVEGRFLAILQIPMNLNDVRPRVTGGGAQAFRWDGQGTAGLGYLPHATGVIREDCDRFIGCSVGTRESVATGVSANGQVVAGYSLSGCEGFCPSTPQPSRAFVWTAAGGLQEIGGDYTQAHGVSGDGRVIVGSSGRSESRAFVWTAAGGLRELQNPGPGHARAVAASFDGSIAVGTWAGQATLWNASGQATLLGLLDEGGFSNARDVSFDGSVVIGAAGRYSYSSVETSTAFRWTEATGMTSLGYLAGDTHSEAAAVSGDGRVIVGTSFRFDHTLARTDTPFRWTAQTGLQSLAGWLAGGDVALPGDVVLLTANDTNYNGQVVVGTYRLASEPTQYPNGPQVYGFLARVGDAGSGFITDLGRFQSGIYEAGLHTLDTGALLPGMAIATARRHGGWNATAQADGNGCGWLVAGRTRYKDDGPELDAQEIGGCVGLGTMRLALGAGRLQAEQFWSFGGGGEFDGRYALLGVAVPFGDRFEASLTGYRGKFDADIERRYESGARIDASAAMPEGEFTAAVARLDWKDAVRWGRVGLSPYLTYAWSETEVEAYTETGGGFPVAFGQSSVNSRELALGAIAQADVGRRSSLGLGLETMHRNVDTGDGTNARVIGLFDASMPGAEAEETVSHVLLQARHGFTPTASVRFIARTALGGDRKATDLSLQAHLAF